MKIIISGQHLEDFPKFEKYAQKKFAKLEKFYKKIEKMDIKLITEKPHKGKDQDYYCEVEVDIPGQNISIIDTERSMDKAIDKAIERLKRLLVKTKEKRITQKHKEGILRKLLSRLP